MPNIINEVKLDFKDVLLQPKFSTLRSRNDVDLYKEITFRNSGQTYKGIPVIWTPWAPSRWPRNYLRTMRLSGSCNVSELSRSFSSRSEINHGLFTSIRRQYSVEEWRKFATKHPECLKHIAANFGTSEAEFERMADILNTVKELKFISVVVATGYLQNYLDYIKRIRACFPTHTIIAGGVATGEIVEELILSGADIVKVGIGGGSVCTTRIKTGVGYPQLSAVIECAEVAHRLKGHIISDGGCTCPGDIAKAFSAGADFVMMGGMFAGHDQSGGDLVTTAEGRKIKQFYGTSSSTYMEKHYGRVAEYKTPEGKLVEVEYRGDVGVTVKDILGGLRSTCTYLGATCLGELPRRATFIRCSRQVNDIFS